MKNTKNSAVATKEQEIFYPAHATKKATKTTKKSTKKSEVKTMENTANATLQTLIDTLGSEAILTILQTVATNAAKPTPTKKATKSVPVTIREHISAPKKEKKVPKMFVSKNELAKQRKKWSSKKGVKLAVEGDWLWLSGNTKQYKDELKADGWRFTPKSKRGSWAIALNTANC